METAQVLNLINAAFSGVARPHASLRQFSLTDQKGMAGTITDREWTNAGNMRSDQTWQEIPDREIEECGVVLAHMDAPEFQYYLPAYMRYSIRHADRWSLKWEILAMTVSSLHPSAYPMDVWHAVVAKYSLLTRAQRQAVVQFLGFVVHNAADILRPDARDALEHDWPDDVVRDGFDTNAAVSPG
jgi:hypothetical protein